MTDGLDDELHVNRTGYAGGLLAVGTMSLLGAARRALWFAALTTMAVAMAALVVGAGAFVDAVVGGHDANGVLLAAEPFLDVDGDAVSHLLVPQGALRQVEIEVVDRSGELRRPASIRATLDAVHHGRSAARAERLGDRKESFARWRKHLGAMGGAR